MAPRAVVPQLSNINALGWLTIIRVAFVSKGQSGAVANRYSDRIWGVCDRLRVLVQILIFRKIQIAPSRERKTPAAFARDRGKGQSEYGHDTRSANFRQARNLHRG